MFFFNLFRKKRQAVDPSDYVIDISDTRWTINGRSFEVPCHIGVFEAAFGKPRVTKNKNYVYTWDDLGIYCYAQGWRKTVVHCFAVEVQRGDMPQKFHPKSKYRGTLTIGGRPWEQAMHEGENVEDFYRQVVTDGLSIVSEFSSLELLDNNGCEGAYTGVEISLRGYDDID